MREIAAARVGMGCSTFSYLFEKRDGKTTTKESIGYTRRKPSFLRQRFILMIF